MKYITSKKSFPIGMVDAPLSRKALNNRPGAMFIYNDGDAVFRVRARDFEYSEIMKKLKLAQEIYERQLKNKIDLNRSSAIGLPEPGKNIASDQTGQKETAMGGFSKKIDKKKPNTTGPSDVSEQDQPKKSSGSAAPAAETASQAASSAVPATLAPQIRPNEIEARFTAYGKIISVLERDQRFAQMPLSAVNALVGPAIITRQYAVVQSQKQGVEVAGPPVAIVLWANVSEDVDRKLTEGVNSTVELATEDWNSGDIPWLMLSSGEERAINAVLKSLSEKLPDGKLFRVRVTDKDGNNQISAIQVKERSVEG